MKLNESVLHFLREISCSGSNVPLQYISPTRNPLCTLPWPCIWPFYWSAAERSQSCCCELMLHLQVKKYIKKYSTIKSMHFTLSQLWPSDTIWHHRTWSKSVQVMACCLTAPIHYLKQCWLIISEDSRHSPQAKFSKYIPLIWVWKLLM